MDLSFRLFHSYKKSTVNLTHKNETSITISKFYYKFDQFI